MRHQRTAFRTRSIEPMATQSDTSFISSRQTGLSASKLERLVSIAVLAAVALAIVLGWLNRQARWIDPEQGIGYALGVIGASMMVLLLAYPLRKHTKRKLRPAGSVGFWFRFHMLLGLAGPLAILYHSRFTFGSLNSAVALSAMIVVASSGLIGRFLYSRVHRGYSDRKLELRSLKDEMHGMLQVLAREGVSQEEIRERLQPFEQDAVEAGRAFWTSARAVIGLGLRTRTAERRLLRSLTKLGGDHAQDVAQTAVYFFQASRRAAEFAFYDRLLRLWHLLHLPLFILMVAAVILHIVAVHMY